MKHFPDTSILIHSASTHATLSPHIYFYSGVYVCMVQYFCVQQSNISVQYSQRWKCTEWHSSPSGSMGAVDGSVLLYDHDVIHAYQFRIWEDIELLEISWVVLVGSSCQMRDEDMLMPKRPRRDSPSAFKSHTPSPTPSIKSESSSRSRKSDESESDTEINEIAMEIMDEINCTVCKLVLILSLFCWHKLLYSSLHSRVSFHAVQVLHKIHLHITSIVEKLFSIHTLLLTAFTHFIISFS